MKVILSSLLTLVTLTNLCSLSVGDADFRSFDGSFQTRSSTRHFHRVLGAFLADVDERFSRSISTVTLILNFHHQQDTPLMPYKFAYSVYDPPSGNKFSQEENSDGFVVRGFYTVLLPDSRVQTVTYVSGPDGHKAQVSYSGEAEYPVNRPQSPTKYVPPEDAGPYSPPAKILEPSPSRYQDSEYLEKEIFKVPQGFSTYLPPSTSRDYSKKPDRPPFQPSYPTKNDAVRVPVYIPKPDVLGDVPIKSTDQYQTKKPVYPSIDAGYKSPIKTDYPPKDKQNPGYSQPQTGEYPIKEPYGTEIKEYSPKEPSYAAPPSQQVYRPKLTNPTDDYKTNEYKTPVGEPIPNPPAKKEPTAYKPAEPYSPPKPAVDYQVPTKPTYVAPPTYEKPKSVESGPAVPPIKVVDTYKTPEFKPIAAGYVPPKSAPTTPAKEKFPQIKTIPYPELAYPSYPIVPKTPTGASYAPPAKPTSYAPPSPSYPIQVPVKSAPYVPPVAPLYPAPVVKVVPYVAPPVSKPSYPLAVAKPNPPVAPLLNSYGIPISSPNPYQTPPAKVVPYAAPPPVAPYSPPVYKTPAPYATPYTVPAPKLKPYGIPIPPVVHYRTKGHKKIVHSIVAPAAAPYPAPYPAPVVYG